jgi:predicted nucleotidyltransferase/DNA-binding transcriptional ArsR family regulator
MDLSDPTQAVTATLDGPVLAVLANSGRPLTVGEVASNAARGSEIGVRRSLARLVDQGIVVARQMGRNKVHELNRDHVAAPVAQILADLRLELWRRLRGSLAGWQPKPIYASVFGSAARGDGGPDSDVDILLIHPPFAGELQLPNSVLETLVDLVTAPMSPEGEERWLAQIDALHLDVLRWTGNAAQVLDVSFHEWRHHAEPALLDAVRSDSIVLAGVDLFSPSPSG